MIEPYTALVVDDEESLLDFFGRFLERYSIAAKTYSTAEACLSDIRSTELMHDRQPDLILVDLELRKGKMKGQDLIARLNDLDIPSEIVAMSGNVAAAELEAAIGIGAGSYVAKPSNIQALGPELERLAAIGRNRRMYRMRASTPPTGIAKKRRQRPVFLSYSTANEKAANFLRKSLEARGIGVWYAPTALHPGDQFRKEIDKGVDNAQVFIAMLSDAYVLSEFCVAELKKFARRAAHDDSLVLIPVLVDISPATMKSPTVAQLIHKLHYVRFERVVDCLTVVLGGIQLALETRTPQARRKRA